MGPAEAAVGAQTRPETGAQEQQHSLSSRAVGRRAVAPLLAGPAVTAAAPKERFGRLVVVP